MALRSDSDVSLAFDTDSYSNLKDRLVGLTAFMLKFMRFMKKQPQTLTLNPEAQVNPVVESARFGNSLCRRGRRAGGVVIVVDECHGMQISSCEFDLEVIPDMPGSKIQPTRTTATFKQPLRHTPM